jgi:hypothetical protein
MISLIIPCHNEMEDLSTLYARVRTVTGWGCGGPGIVDGNQI